MVLANNVLHATKSQQFCIIHRKHLDEVKSHVTIAFVLVLQMSTFVDKLNMKLFFRVQ